jgi:UDP-GlcNAc:undecaprenyl-phosphate GlcNAc-1-phosphate transferase
MVAVAAFLGFVVTVVFMFALRPVAMAIGLVDVPAGRKRHPVTVPVIGGVAMSIGLGIGTSLVPHPESWMPILLGVYLLVVVGTIDDRFDLPPNVRLIAQICAALLVVLASGNVVIYLGEFFGHKLGVGPFRIPFTILFIVTLVNAYNFIDGLDGLAGGLALLALSFMAIISVGTPWFGIVTVAAGVVAGYLLFNLPLGFNRAVRAFMGDAGSTALGLIIATAGVYLSQPAASILKPTIGLWFVAVPVFDLFASIVRRSLNKRSPFDPDHQHLHHVLVEHGLRRSHTVAAILGLAVVFAAVGLTGEVLGVDSGIMVALWLAAGVAYYQLLRFPRFAIAALSWLPRPAPPTPPAKVDEEKRPSSES